MRWRWIAVLTIVGAIGLITATVLVLRARRWDSTLMTLQGAVIRHDADPQKELPISDAVVTATRGTTTVTVHSDAAGYFRIKFPEVIWPGQTLLLHFQHDDYRPLDMSLKIQFSSMMPSIVSAAMSPQRIA